MARPTKYSLNKETAIAHALKNGATRTAAAESVGIHYDTFKQWLTDKPEFSLAVTRAEAEAEMVFTNAILKAAKGSKDQPADWRAAEAWLKRRRRAEWGDSVQAQVEVTDGGIIDSLQHKFAEIFGRSDAPAIPGEPDDRGGGGP